MRSGPPDKRLRADIAGEHGPVARTGYQPFLQRTPYAAGLMPGVGLYIESFHIGNETIAGLPPPHEKEPGADAGAGLLAESYAGAYRKGTEPAGSLPPGAEKRHEIVEGKP